MIYNPFYFGFFPVIPQNCDKPPTVYSILNSIVNGEKNDDEYTKIKNLPKEGRATIFNFDYPLSENVSRETFEVNILNHYLMRRIGFDTVTAFRINLNAKLNEIMPIYNKMFDSLENWNIFEDGETTIREGTENRKSAQNSESTNTLENSSNTNNTSTQDRRSSDTPQSKIQNIKNASYLTNYEYNEDTSKSTDSSNSNGTSTSNTNGTDDNIYKETIKRSPADKISILKEMQENIKSIYTLIYQDLDCLFYGLF